MKKNLTLLLAVVATASLGGSAEAGSLSTRTADIRPGADCMPFAGTADITVRHGNDRACSIRVAALVYEDPLVYEHPKVPGRPVLLLTIPRGVHTRGACLAPGLELEVSIARVAQGRVGALALDGSGFSLRAIPSALARQECLLTTFDSPEPTIAKARVEALDEQHLQVITE